MKDKISLYVIIYIFICFIVPILSYIYSDNIHTYFCNHTSIYTNAITSITIFIAFSILMIDKIFINIDITKYSKTQAKRLKQYIILPNITKFLFCLSMNFISLIFMILDLKNWIFVSIIIISFSFNILIPKVIYNLVVDNIDSKINQLPDE